MMRPLLLFSHVRTSILYVGMVILCFGMSQNIQAQTCDPVIDGPAFVCKGNTQSYINTHAGGAFTNEWSLPDGGGTFIGGNTAAQATVRWTGPVGYYDLVLTERSIPFACEETTTLTVYVDTTGAPQMNCNDTIHLSLNQFCEAEITVDMALEGGHLPEGVYDIVIEDEDGNIITDNMVDRSHLGQVLEFTVYHRCSGNSCWGKIKVEDKLPPMLECDTFLLNCNEDITPSEFGHVQFPFKPGYFNLNEIGPQEYTVEGVDPCGPVTVEYEDVVINNTCPPFVEFIQIIERTWTATDEYGTSTSCTDTLKIRTGTLADLIYPPNYDNLDEPALNCADSFKRDHNGYPHPDVTGMPTGSALCPNIQADYHDFKLGICESSYKLVREWLIVDWCAGTSVYYNQIIKVLDEDGPMVTCPDTLIVSINSFTCEGETDLPHPVVTKECSDWDYKVYTLPAEQGKIPNLNDASDEYVTRNRNGTYHAAKLPVGINYIYYVLEDNCGNTSVCTTVLLIQEDAKPTAVCDQNTVVALSNEGTAKVYATTFDDGSHDNCEIDRFEVRRMDPGNCPPGVADDTRFREYVEFCCADIPNNPIIVVLRVYDKSGNYNECMVEIEVQDEFPPEIYLPTRHYNKLPGRLF